MKLALIFFEWLLVLFARILFGVILACIVYMLVARYAWMGLGCFRWDPGAKWRPPLTCGVISGLLGVFLPVTCGVAFFLPFLLGKRR